MYAFIMFKHRTADVVRKLFKGGMSLLISSVFVIKMSKLNVYLLQTYSSIRDN